MTDAAPVTMSVDRLAGYWLKMQAARDKLKADYNKADTEIKDQQDEVGNVLNVEMAKIRGETLKTAFGTIERKLETHANASDWGAIWRFIKENDKFELVQKRLTTTEVMKWAEANAIVNDAGVRVPQLPPGVSTFTKYKLTVKKPGGKSLPTTED